MKNQSRTGRKAHEILRIRIKEVAKAGDLSIDDQIKVSIFNFIRTIHLNKQDFIQESYGAEYFGDLPMTFKKKAGQVMGLITVKTKDEERLA